VTHALSILLQIHVGGGQPVDDDQAGRAPIGTAVSSHWDTDAVLELRIQVSVEEIGWFHDVHVGIDESEAVLHRTLPCVECAARAYAENPLKEGRASSDSANALREHGRARGISGAAALL
jgi:hypothetical protein